MKRRTASALIGDRAPARPAARAFPFVDLKAQFRTIRGEVMAGVKRVMESQQFILGGEVEAFEREIAGYLRVGEAVSCASGTSALELALWALRIGAGDEVITTPYTFVATASAIAMAGALPVFVDIEPETYNIDPAAIKAAITSRTRAIIPVHLFGLPADMGTILKIAAAHKLAVIEDAAQSIGARCEGRYVGGMGAMGCFSFFPSKNLGGAGDGGMVTTNDPGLAATLRLIRTYGATTRYRYETLGVNSRLDALQAAVLRAKLPHLAEWTDARRSAAARYRSLFHERGLDRIRLPEDPSGGHVFNQFVVRCRRRDEIRGILTEQGIPTEIYYPTPLHLQPAFAHLGYGPGDFPEAEAASEESLALPIFPEISAAQQESLVNALGRFF